MLWILTCVFVGANFVAVIFLVWLPKFLFDKFQMSLSAAGFSAKAFLQLAPSWVSWREDGWQTAWHGGTAAGG